MDPELLKLAAGSGIFCVLFVFLLKWVMGQQERRDESAVKREERLMTFVESVGPTLQATTDELRALTSITQRIEKKVNACDELREKEKAALAEDHPPERRQKMRTA